MILYSFNQSAHSRLPQVNYKWEGFTLQWYQQWNGIPGLTPAFFLSIKLALATTVVAAILGTLLALALVKYRFRGKRVVEQTLFLNIAAPEIVLGASLLGFFITMNLSRGFTTLLLAHVMFSIAYVAITVRARLSGYDLNVEWAAQDLGATPWVTFWKVTLPLIYPGIMAGALLAFALSIDDFVTSSFVAGNVHDVPAVGLRRGPRRHPAAGLRVRHRDLHRRRDRRGHEPRVAGSEEATGGGRLGRRPARTPPRRTSWTSRRSSTSRCGEPRACEDFHKRPKVPSDLRKRL